jgi:hypothetical protein
MSKPKVVSIQKETTRARLIARDAKVQRIIIGIGGQRIAYDFHAVITHLAPETGDQPATILPMKGSNKIQSRKVEGPAGKGN